MNLRHAARRTTLAISFAGALLVGCATTDRMTEHRLAPLTAANLEKARKQCRIRDVALIQPDLIHFSGLQEIGEPARNYRNETDCLRRIIKMPTGPGIHVVIG
jgi:hypothetical protein